MKIHLFNICLLLVLIIGFTVRFWDLGKNPAGFFCDEASIGYNAYSILTIGRDEYGASFPLFFKAFGEYKNPLDIYSTIPFIKLFGLSEFSVRFASAFFSFLSIIVIYLIGIKIRDKLLGLILASILAFNPWSVHLARINMEGFSILIFFILCSLLSLSKYYSENKLKNLVIFSILSSISVYSYFPARIVIPIFFIIISLLIIIHKKNIKLFIPIVIFLILLTPLIFHSLKEGMSRWNQTTVFSDHTVDPKSKIITSYLLHFSPDYLFIKGDIDMVGQFVTRHSIRGVGEFYLWQLPFFLLGFIFLIKEKNKIKIPILILLFLYPIPSSLTTDLTPQATRSVIGIVPITFLIAYGIWGFSKWLKKYYKTHVFFLLIIFILIIISLIFFINLYKKYPLYSSGWDGWQLAIKQSIDYSRIRSKQYDDLLITHRYNQGDELIKFYSVNYPCAKCRVMSNPISIDINRKQLFALKKEDINEAVNLYPQLSFNIKKIIYLPDNKPEIFIGTFQ